MDNRHLRRIHIHMDDLHKLKKHRSLQVDKYLICVDDIPVPQVKMYGKPFNY